MDDEGDLKEAERIDDDIKIEASVIMKLFGLIALVIALGILAVLPGCSHIQQIPACIKANTNGSCSAIG